jgi:hypothetical protein
MEIGMLTLLLFAVIAGDDPTTKVPDAYKSLSVRQKQAIYINVKALRAKGDEQAIETAAKRAMVPDEVVKLVVAEMDRNKGFTDEEINAKKEAQRKRSEVARKLKEQRMADEAAATAAAVAKEEERRKRKAAKRKAAGLPEDGPIFEVSKTFDGYKFEAGAEGLVVLARRIGVNRIELILDVRTNQPPEPETRTPLSHKEWMAANVPTLTIEGRAPVRARETNVASASENGNYEQKTLVRFALQLVEKPRETPPFTITLGKKEIKFSGALLESFREMAFLTCREDAP